MKYSKAKQLGAQITDLGSPLYELSESLDSTDTEEALIKIAIEKALDILAFAVGQAEEVANEKEKETLKLYNSLQIVGAPPRKPLEHLPEQLALKILG